MGNTLGALVFLGAAAWLGWEIYKGRAQAFLTQLSHGTAPAGAQGSPAAAPGPQAVQGGPLQGVTPGTPPTNPLQQAPPTVWGGVFGENGSSNSPVPESPYGVYSPLTWEPY